MPIPLTIKEVNDKLHVFYQGIKGNPVERGITYFNMSINNSAQKKVEGIKSINPALFDCSNEVKKIVTKPGLDDTAILFSVSQIESDRKNLEYSLNTRGLLLYILGMINEENKQSRARNVEISNVLENLAESYKEEFPFLMYYKEVKEVYDKLAKKLRRPEYEYFQAKLIKQIALELQHNIDTINKKELDYYIAKRYSEKLTNYFISPILPGSPSAGLVGIIPLDIRKYLVRNLQYIREYLEEELKNTNYDIEQFSVNL